MMPQRPATLVKLDPNYENIDQLQLGCVLLSAGPMPQESETHVRQPRRNVQ